VVCSVIDFAPGLHKLTERSRLERPVELIVFCDQAFMKLGCLPDQFFQWVCHQVA
jgi:hypothetical protein